MELWISKLMTPDIDRIEAEDRESAISWIEDLKEKNPEFYEDTLSKFRKKVRDDLSEHGNALWVLHDSAKANLMRLKEAEVGLIILDECHHLLEHWGEFCSKLLSFWVIQLSWALLRLHRM